MRVPNSIAFALVVLSYAGAGAAQIARPAPKPPSRAELAASVQKLKSGDEAQIRTGLDDLRVAGSAAGFAAPAVADLLSRGLPQTLTHQAIDTLGDLESPDGSPILVQYAAHRTVALRRAAVKALTHTKGAAAATALRRSLGDSDALVRSNAAAGLGAMKAKDAVPDLFVALDHKVNEAAASIGQLCNADQCEQLAAKLGKLPFDVVMTGLDQVIFRPSSEVTDDTKIKVLGRLRELGTAEANRFLKDVEKRLRKDASPRIKQAVEQAVKATMGGSQ
jgi:HEAT repeat protein